MLKKVIVIGAGAAGLEAASTLLARKAFDVKILEASNMIGGRIRQIEGFADFPLELGAEYVHGSKSANYKYAQRLGARLVERNFDQLICSQDYKESERKLIEEDSNYRKAYIECYDQGLGEIQIDRDIKLKEYAESLKSLNGKPFPKFVYRGIAHTWGADWKNISAKGMQAMDKELEDYIADENDPGDFDNFLIGPPYNQSMVLEHTFKHVYDNILLNTKVTSIDYSTPEIKIKDQNQQTYSADAVIVTVPLSILKKRIINFTPDLPTSKQQAIKELGITNGGKIYMRFKKNYWGDYWGIRNDGFLVSYRSAGQVHKSEQNRILMGFVMGTEADQLSAMTKEEQKNIMLKDLGGIFGFEVVQQNYEDHIYYDWGLDENIQGAYSFPATENAGDHRKALEEPVSSRLYFAGEAADSRGYSQTVSGALNTGRLAAETITKSLQ